MSLPKRLYTSSLGKKLIMAATGLLLGAFLIIHALGNTSIFWGRTTFISYATHLHKLGILIPLFEALLLGVLLVHICTGCLLFLQNRRARGVQYTIRRDSGGRSWGSKTMIFSGGIILLFIIIHLVNFHFTDHCIPIADIVSPVLSNPLYTVIYLIGLAALTLHISHGFWSLLQTFGLSHPSYDRLLRRLSLLTTGAISSVFVLIVLLLLFSRTHLS